MKTLLKVIAALIAAIIIWEGILLALHYEPPKVNNGYFDVYRNDSYYTNFLIKEGHTIYPVRNEVFGTDTEIDYAKPRIVLLGDSYTMGLEVMPKENYVSILQKKYPDISFVNGGILGAAVPEHVIFYPLYEQMSPEFYFLQVNADDFTTNPYQPWNSYRFDYNGTLFVTHKEPQKPGFTETLWQKPVIGKLMRLQTIRTIVSRSEGYFGLDSEPVFDEPPTDFHIGKQMDLLKELYGERIAIIYVPNIPRIDANGLYATDMQDEWRKEIIEEAKKRDIEVIDLTSSYLEYYNTTGQMPFGFYNTQPGTGHWNKAGQMIAAQRISVFIEEKGLTGEMQ